MGNVRYSKLNDREKAEWDKTETPDSPPVKKHRTESIFTKGAGNEF
jgi:hypothetical protein